MDLHKKDFSSLKGLQIILGICQWPLAYLSKKNRLPVLSIKMVTMVERNFRVTLGLGSAGMADLLGRGVPWWRRTQELSMLSLGQCRERGEKNSRVMAACAWEVQGWMTSWLEVLVLGDHQFQVIIL